MDLHVSNITDLESLGTPITFIHSISVQNWGKNSQPARMISTACLSRDTELQ